MNSREFFYAVAEMRRVQRDYFRTRDRRCFLHARSLEDQIDREIARVREIVEQQGANLLKNNNHEEY